MPVWTWSEEEVVEPIDSNVYYREQALALAVQYATSRPRYNSHEVVEIAQEFLNWINNVEVE